MGSKTDMNRAATTAAETYAASRARFQEAMCRGAEQAEAPLPPTASRPEPEPEPLPDPPSPETAEAVADVLAEKKPPHRREKTPLPGKGRRPAKKAFCLPKIDLPAYEFVPQSGIATAAELLACDGQIVYGEVTAENKEKLERAACGETLPIGCVLAFRVSIVMGMLMLKPIDISTKTAKFSVRGDEVSSYSLHREAVRK